jgi:hypothetical protein
MDAKISKDSLAISADYEAVVALSVRQAMGSWELTVGEDLKTGEGDIMAFMKGGCYTLAGRDGGH